MPTPAISGLVTYLAISPHAQLTNLKKTHIHTHFVPICQQVIFENLIMLCLAIIPAPYALEVLIGPFYSAFLALRIKAVFHRVFSLHKQKYSLVICTHTHTHTHPPTLSSHHVYHFFFAMAAATAPHALNNHYNNSYYNQNKNYNNNNNTYNIITTLFTISTKNLNTLLSTTLKTLQLLPPPSTNYPPPSSSQFSPPLPVSPSLPPAPKGITWCTMYHRSSQTLIPSSSPYFKAPSLLFRSTLPPPSPPPSTSAGSCPMNIGGEILEGDIPFYL